METIHDAKIMLPGFGMPITAGWDSSQSFPNALFSHRPYQAPLLTIREYTMMELMNRISDKPNWQKKILDDAIAAKWKTEALEMPDVDVSEKMVDWCIAELRHKAELFETTGSVEALDGVFKSDTIISEDLRLALRKAVISLENVPEKERDWHPYSDEKVLDLVHPSIYPLVYGQTRIIPNDTVGLEDCMRRCGEGRILQEDSSDEQDEWSLRYQWLPTNFEVRGDELKLTSYINNLHPIRNRELYSVLERIIRQTIPMWDQTLAKLRKTSKEISRAPRIVMEDYGFDDEEKPVEEEGEHVYDFWSRTDAWMSRRPVVQPEPGKFTVQREYKKPLCSILRASPADFETPINLREDFGKIQIIIKLANIHLTPAKPSYDGGSWHVEGQANEAICATALYYYDSDNISESLLAFRQQVDHDEHYSHLVYEQGEHRAIETIYGIENESPAIQDLGSVVTSEGRLLTFPNVMQHRVHPFRLADPSKPGHRKILALFLVDPHQPIISTANVPCQQKSWWDDQVREMGPLGQIPTEMTEQILELVDEFPVSVRVAKEQRLELMNERKDFMVGHNGSFENMNHFNLCEH